MFDGLVHLRFGVDREPLRRMHTALEALAQHCSIQGAYAAPQLVPTAEERATATRLLHLVHLQPPLELVQATASQLHACTLGSQQLNEEQAHAVAAIVEGAGRAAPFTLFGPPGASKQAHHMLVLRAHRTCTLSFYPLALHLASGAQALARL